MKTLDLSPEIREQILLHANEEFPRECCGFVMCDKGKPSYQRVRNIHADPRSFFQLAPEDLLPRLEDRANLVCFVHSHPNASAKPSDADRILCENLAVPFFIVAFPSGDWSETFPEGWELPFVGRKFVHGVVDCYTLFRDYYKRVLGIDLTNYARDDYWWRKGANLYLDNVDGGGFVKVDDLKEHDVLLLTIDSEVPNHAAIYVGRGMLLHHVMNRLSCYQPLGGFWLKNHYCTIRHKSLCPSSTLPSTESSATSSEESGS